MDLSAIKLELLKLAKDNQPLGPPEIILETAKKWSEWVLKSSVR